MSLGPQSPMITMPFLVLPLARLIKPKIMIMTDTPRVMRAFCFAVSIFQPMGIAPIELKRERSTEGKTNQVDRFQAHRVEEASETLGIVGQRERIRRIR
jgi:hypothetical protein